MSAFAASTRAEMACIDATVIRADGRRENLGTVSYWHRSPLKRLAWSLQQIRQHGLKFRPMPMIVAVGPEAALFALATVFTHSGKAIITNRIIAAGTEPKWIGWGTGAGTAVVGDTTLFTEASETRAVGTGSRVTTTQTNDTYQTVGTITADGAKTITNAGSFDALTVGNLCVKGDFTGILLALSDSIQFTIKLQFT